jgi:hypothetical protein
MPDKVPAGNETLLHALPEDQPDSLSEGQKSKQADIDATPAEKAGTPDKGSAGEDAVVSNGADESAPKKAAKKSSK